ncbi:MAG: type II toxin-antitoxin system Phd/YefM family antitoxin [Scytonema sp. PMC 1069.18]|nr:type II toxin-antitoxin system Phd/YefM family antitoxin [Scytonema sp. PMC 1069.18]MEC4886968.1 type II toxin-antitoxin system Phd/YefM family antitoxin [Scytonema sp. PMC 1070.18]
MEYLSSKEAQNNFGMLIDKALRHPVVIRRHNRDCVVVMSIEDYMSYRKLKLKELEECRDKLAEEAERNGLTEEVLQEILGNEE